MQPGNQYAKLPPVTGLRQGDVAQVEFDIEVGILYPVRLVVTARHLHKAGTEQRQFVQLLLKTGNNILEADEAAWRCRWVVDPHPANVLGGGGVLQIDKSRIEYP